MLLAHMISRVVAGLAAWQPPTPCRCVQGGGSYNGFAALRRKLQAVVSGALVGAGSVGLLSASLLPAARHLHCTIALGHRWEAVAGTFASTTRHTVQVPVIDKTIACKSKSFIWREQQSMCMEVTK